MAAPTSLGAIAPKIGFTGTAPLPAGVWREGQEISNVANEETVRDERNAVVAVVVSDPAVEVSVNGTVMATGFTQSIIGAKVTLATTLGRVTESKLSESKLLSRVSLKVRKEGSMTYT